jgi:acetyltransferase
MFGPAMALTVAGGNPAYELPPLNLSLAEQLCTRAGVVEHFSAVARLLVRVSQLIVDEPSIAALRLDMLHIGAATGFASPAISLRPPGRSAQLAISPYPEHLSETYVAGGQSFIIRPIRPEDAEAHKALIARLPPDDLRYRFFTSVRELSPEQIVRLTQIDYDREMAFIAVRQTDKATVGVARLVREIGDARGEFAIVVEPDVKGCGLARHLMQLLIDWGRGQGMAEIAGTILADNQPMLGFVRHLGFAIHRVPDESDVLEATFSL